MSNKSRNFDFDKSLTSDQATWRSLINSDILSDKWQVTLPRWKEMQADALKTSSFHLIR